MNENQRFFFTYGVEDQPFCGGWTVIEVPNIHAACALFRAYHPDKTEGLLNCSSVYSEKEFYKTSMAGPDGNFGQRCHELITVRHETAERKRA